MKTIELFCGTKSFSKVASKKGHITITYDIDRRFSPDILIDVLKLPDNIAEGFDILWASPPLPSL